jgi:hypothetical protein
VSFESSVSPRLEGLKFLQRCALSLALLALSGLPSACSGSSSTTTGDVLPSSELADNHAMIVPRAGVSDTPSCGSLEAKATSSYRPIDVIFVVDNSSSMNDEIAEVQARINADFAASMQNSGLDYRVIMISRYGEVGVPVGLSHNPICVGPPLGASNCADPMRVKLENSSRFFHFSADVQSHDALCVLLGGFSQADEYADAPRAGWVPLAPTGWSEYLRPEAFKTFVVISDDDVNCKGPGYAFSDQATVSGGEKSAADFDSALLHLSPTQFGSAKQRNYIWHSIVGLQGRAAADAAWSPSDPIGTARCPSGAQGPGTGYQALSRLTGGLRYPSCDHQSFNAVFNTIAQGILGGAEISCEWQIPAPPSGEEFYRDHVNVSYTPSDGGPSLSIPNVDGLAQCGAHGGWYYDDPTNPKNLSACPSTCGYLKRDAEAQVDVLFGCATQVLVR